MFIFKYNYIYAVMALTPLKNNSKKISELTARDVITYHQSYSWIPIAQYDHRIDSYTNLAINIASITSYAIEHASDYTYQITYEQRIKDFERYEPEEWKKLLDVGKVEVTNSELSYLTNVEDAITNSPIAYNLTTYSIAYTLEHTGWQYLGYNTIEHPKYLYNELEEYVLTPDGRKITI